MLEKTKRCMEGEKDLLKCTTLVNTNKIYVI